MVTWERSAPAPPASLGSTLSNSSGGLPCPTPSGINVFLATCASYATSGFSPLATVPIQESLGEALKEISFQTQSLMGCFTTGTLLNPWTWCNLLSGTPFLTSIESKVQTLRLVCCSIAISIGYVLLFCVMLFPYCTLPTLLLFPTGGQPFLYWIFKEQHCPWSYETHRISKMCGRKTSTIQRASNSSGRNYNF